MSYSLIGSSLLVCCLSVSPWLSPALGAAESTTVHTAAEVDREALIAAGITWLSAQQTDEGAFTSGQMFRLGITALSTLALLENDIPADDPRVSKAIAWLLHYQQPDGGIYDPQEGLANYGTSMCLMVFTRAGGIDPAIIHKAQQFILGTQNTEEGSPLNGGFAYDARDQERADLSNTAISIEALRTSGIPADHPAMKRALAFVERCQNLSSVNDAPWAGNDGSGVYAPEPERSGGSHGGGDQAAQPSANAEAVAGVGTMTYALIKSYLLLDVPADDPRVQTALAWVGNNYQFDRNPGMAARNKEDGLFYYYLLMATTLNQTATKTLMTAAGEAHWRKDLAQEIAKRANALGPDHGAFWINNSQRWGEGIPQLTTAYMLRALAKTKPSIEP